MNIAVLIYHDVLDFEVSSAMTAFKTAARFTQNPLEIFTIHRTRASVLGSSGLVMTPSYAMSAAPEPDVLIVPGGAGIEKLFKDSISKEYFKAHKKRVKHMILGSNGALLFGEYGLLEQHTITAFPTLLETLWKFNPADVQETRNVTDGNLRSISRSGAMLEVCLEVIDLEFGVGQQVQQHLGSILK
jgi:transcriptional regulator GlxA family with amidase domain